VFAKIEQREGKHAAQFVEQVLAPFFPAMHKNFGVGFCGEGVTCQSEAFAQFPVVVQFAVKDYRHIAALIPNGLVATGQINDAKPAHAQSHAGRSRFVNQEAVFIGPAMHHGGSHASDGAVRSRRRGRVGESANATHALLNLR
jgi:hypothetical protein